MKSRFRSAEHLQHSLTEVIYSSRAIADVDHLKGRSKEVSALERALLTPGRQPFIFGLRGAGKTSLALSVGRQYAQTENVLVTCAPQMTFGEVIRSLTAAALEANPLEQGRSIEYQGNGTLDLWLVKGGGNILETKSYGGVPCPRDPNEAFSLLKKAAQVKAKRFCFIIDEFDQLNDHDSHLQFGLLAKLIADSGAPIKLILCGVADDVQQIFKAHASTLRLFEPIEVNRLGLQACFDIMEDVEKKLKLQIERETQFRIAQISDGFPYFVHLIAEKTIWQWFEDPGHDDNRTSPRHYESGLVDASQSAAPELKDPYELAANKYALDGELIVWALATGNLLEKQIKQIHKEFCRLYERLDVNERPESCLNQKQLSARISLFMKDGYGCMIKSPRRSHYAFTEKRMRGYARLRAALRGIELAPDHPLVP